MSYDEYWNQDPWLAKDYRDAWELKQKTENYNAWLQGLYNYKAFGVILGNAFRKKGAKADNYFDKPIEFDEETRAACKSAEQATAMGRQAMGEVWESLLPRLYQLEQEVPGSRCFTFRCVLCPEGCTRPEGKPCRHPERLRHSLESVGFDIVAMAHDLLDIDLEWSHDGSLPKHITLVTALFS